MHLLWRPDGALGLPAGSGPLVALADEHSPKAAQAERQP